MDIKIINKSTNDTPTYSTKGAAGFDIRANESKLIFPGELQIINTELYFEIPEGYALFILSRSGLASKGIVVGNSPGLIDSDFRNQVKIILKNSNAESPNNVFKVSVGDRIAQGVVMKVENINFINSTSLSNTERDQAGFGSTGIS